MTNLEHITNLAEHGACIRAGEERIPLTEELYRDTVGQCERYGYNAVTYELILPGIDDGMAVCIWRDGHVDSGSMRSICGCLAAR